MSIATYHLLLCDGRDCQHPARTFNPAPNHRSAVAYVRAQARKKGWLTDHRTTGPDGKPVGPVRDLCPACAKRPYELSHQWTAIGSGEFERPKLPNEPASTELMAIADVLHRSGYMALPSIPEAETGDQGAWSRFAGAAHCCGVDDIDHFREELATIERLNESASLPEKIVEALLDAMELLTQDSPDLVSAVNYTRLIGAAATAWGHKLREAENIARS